MFLVRSSKYLSNVLYCERDLGFVFDDVVFSKGGFLGEENVV